MDLFNNEVGIAISKENKELEEYKSIIINAVKQGRCKIIKTNKKGDYLDIDGNIILKETLKGKWKNNKCLVASNVI